MEALLGPSAIKEAVVALPADRRQYTRLLLPGSKPPEWAAALAYPRWSYIVMGPYGPAERISYMESLLAHEYAHVALGHATRFRSLPSWFVEGFADLAAFRIGLFTHDQMVPEIPLDLLKGRFPADRTRAGAAYQQSRDFVAYLYHSRSPEEFHGFLKLLQQGTPFEQALERIYGKDLETLSKRWRRSWRFRNFWIPLITSGAFLWFLASLLLVMGYVRQRRRRRMMEAEPEVIWEAPELRTAQKGSPIEEERWIENESWADEAHAQKNAGPARRWSMVILLAGAGLTFFLVALLRTIWPFVSLFLLITLSALAVLSLLLILFWKGERAPEDDRDSEKERGPENNSCSKDQDPDTFH